MPTDCWEDCHHPNYQSYGEKGGCVNCPHNCCYICGELMIKKHLRNITYFVKKIYYGYFKDKSKSFALYIVCFICVEDLKEAV